MTKREPIGDWRIRLRRFLVSGGTNGRTQNEIVVMFANVAKAHQLNAELDAYHLEDKVQKFLIPPPPHGGPTKTVWRATEKMLEDLV